MRADEADGAGGFFRPGKACMSAKFSVFVVAAALLVFDRPTTGESIHSGSDNTASFSAIPIAVSQEPVKGSDPCADPEMQPNSMSPTWNIQAVPVQCGALETDNLGMLQPMGDGVSQAILAATAKYGLMPRVQLRWGMPGRISQSARGHRRVTGTTDQAVGVLYHFRDQGEWMPDLAIDYGYKIPTANPSKAFGSGYADHVLTFVASRDMGRNHVDFNFAGTLAGGPHGFDRAVQSGAGYSRSFGHNLMGTIEAFGGSQPGTSDRLGAVLLGGSWGIRPWLALNGGYIRSYTAGAPRQQIMLGFIYTIRPGLRGGRVFGR